MVFNPATMTMLAKGAIKYGPAIKKGYDWLAGKKGLSRSDSQSQAEKNYMNMLQSRAKHGMGQAAVNEQLGNVSRTVHQNVNNTKANIMGQAVSQGVEGSGVVAEQHIMADTSGTVAMANAARAIAEKNRQIKVGAEDKLGELGIKETDQRYKEALANRANNDSRRDAFFNEAIGLATEHLEGPEKVKMQARVRDLMADPDFQKLPEATQKLILESLRK